MQAGYHCDGATWPDGYSQDNHTLPRKSHPSGKEDGVNPGADTAVSRPRGTDAVRRWGPLSPSGEDKGGEWPRATSSTRQDESSTLLRDATVP
jgi:hypothetical protein